MIGQAFQLVTDRLNAHLRTQFSVDEDLVSLSPLTESDGKQAEAARNRLVIFMTNLAEDRMPRNSAPDLRARADHPRGPVHLDIYFMIAAGHDAEIYGEGLKLISAALMYLQTRPLWTPANTPEMPEGIAQLTMEICNLRVEETAQLWGNLGGHYVPSVMIKMRSIMLDAAAAHAPVPSITAPSRRVARREAEGAA